LLYVAMTRAEEALFIGGALNAKEKAPNPDSWYARLQPLFDGEWLVRSAVGRRSGTMAPRLPWRLRDTAGAGGQLALLPPWVDRLGCCRTAATAATGTIVAGRGCVKRSALSGGSRGLRLRGAGC
jgi:hypothetical protein